MVKVVRMGPLLKPDSGRVMLRPFGPGNGPRTTRLLGRLMALTEAQVDTQLALVLGEFRGRHHRLEEACLDRFTALQAGGEFIAHAVGVGTTDMVALQKDLVAAAHAHELMAELVEARIGVSAEEHHAQHGDEQHLRDAQFSSSEFPVSSFEFQAF